jgi:peptidoglycan hydrolase-like protein with peptidoglycan-binding domain
MTTGRNVVSPWALAIAAIAVIASGWVLVAPTVVRDAARASASSVHRGNGLRSRPSIRVRAAQRALRKLGYHLRVDGRFGRRTERAVRRYQSRHGLRVDGVVGRTTRRALRRSGARVDRVTRARARRARRARARRHRRAQTHHANAAPRTAAPPAAVLPSPSAPRPSGSPRPVPPASVTQPAAASTDQARRGWVVLLAITVLAVVLFVAAAPVLRESGPGGRRGARSARP